MSTTEYRRDWFVDLIVVVVVVVIVATILLAGAAILTHGDRKADGAAYRSSQQCDANTPSGSNLIRSGELVAASVHCTGDESTLPEFLSARSTPEVNDETQLPLTDVGRNLVNAGDPGAWLIGGIVVVGGAIGVFAVVNLLATDEEAPPPPMPPASIDVEPAAVSAPDIPGYELAADKTPSELEQMTLSSPASISGDIWGDSESAAHMVVESSNGL